MQYNCYHVALGAFFMLMVANSFVVGETASPSLLGLGIDLKGMQLMMLDPNTGSPGKVLFRSSMNAAAPLSLQQPVWDEEEKLLHIVIDVPRAGLLTLDCSDLQNVKQVSFIPTQTPIAAVQLDARSKILYGLVVAVPTQLGFFNLVSFDIHTQSFNVTVRYLLRGVTPFDWPSGSTSLAVDAMNRLLVFPSLGVEGNYWFSTVSLDNTTQLPTNYYMTPNPVMGVVMNPNDQKVYGVINKTDATTGNTVYYWGTVNGTSKVQLISQLQDLPATNDCLPGTMALNPSTNTVYALYGLGYGCPGNNLSWLLINATSGVINNRWPWSADVLLMVWV